MAIQKRMCGETNERSRLEVHLLVNPALVGADPGVGVGAGALSGRDARLVSKPQLELVGGAVLAVRAVDDVAAHIDAKVSADGSGRRVLGVGSSDQAAASGNGPC